MVKTTFIGGFAAGRASSLMFCSMKDNRAIATIAQKHLLTLTN
jgi:hypothetical protein